MVKGSVCLSELKVECSSSGELNMRFHLWPGLSPRRRGGGYDLEEHTSETESLRYLYQVKNAE
jgi:hypothetical protein